MANGALSHGTALSNTCAFCVSIALAALSACGHDQPVPGALTIAGSTMGTSYSVVLPGATSADESSISAAVRERLHRVDALMSTYRADSEVSRFNLHESEQPLAVSPETLAVLIAAQEASAITGGAFDITIGPLVNAWGFGPDEAGEPPSERTVQELRSTAGWEKLILDRQASSARKPTSALQIDLSAIAKGYAADLVASCLEQLGHGDYLIDIGGELRAGGSNSQGELWRIGVERPDGAGRLVHRILHLRDTGVATSGSYRNFREAGGLRFAHILDPRTGRPASNAVVSATVLDPSAMRADAIATALLVLGEQEGIALADREDLAVLLLVEAGGNRLREVESDRFRAKIEHEAQ